MSRFAPIFMTTLMLFATPIMAAETPQQMGERVVTASCAACHKAPGIEGAPLLGDKAAWHDRMGGGRAALYRSALDGFTGYFVMPARGGNPKLSDAEVRAAVDYLLDNSGQP